MPSPARRNNAPQRARFREPCSPARTGASGPTRVVVSRNHLSPQFVSNFRRRSCISWHSSFSRSTCDICARALPRLREIAKKFQNQPFVLLSISVDYKEPAWRAFLEKNEMPGLQYRDGYNGPLAQVFHLGLRLQSNVDHPLGGVGNSMAGVWRQSFGMNEDVPKAFTIDADGVLQSEKLSDSLDATLQQLIDRTSQNQAKQ